MFPLLNGDVEKDTWTSAELIELCKKVYEEIAGKQLCETGLFGDISIGALIAMVKFIRLAKINTKSSHTLVNDIECELFKEVIHKEVA